VCLRFLPLSQKKKLNSINNIKYFNQSFTDKYINSLRRNNNNIKSIQRKEARKGILNEAWAQNILNKYEARKLRRIGSTSKLQIWNKISANEKQHHNICATVVFLSIFSLIILYWMSTQGTLNQIFLSVWGPSLLCSLPVGEWQEIQITLTEWVARVGEGQGKYAYCSMQNEEEGN
jgi:hypothetical protein